MSRKKPPESKYAPGDLSLSYTSPAAYSGSNSVSRPGQPFQVQTTHFDQQTGQWVDAYGRVVQPQQAPYGYEPQPQADFGGEVYPSLDADQPEESNNKHGKGFWIGIILGLLASIAALALAIFLLFGNQVSSRSGDLGQLEGKSDEEIIAELNRVVEEGMFNISIASMVVFPDGTSEGELKIENVPGNKYLMQVDLVRQDNGQVIYKSGILEPNYHIQSDRLSVDLDPGVYECTATFHALDPENEEEVGTAGASVEVVVQG